MGMPEDLVLFSISTILKRLNKVQIDIDEGSEMEKDLVQIFLEVDIRKDQKTFAVFGSHHIKH
jgi:hypothetical protein